MTAVTKQGRERESSHLLLSQGETLELGGRRGNYEELPKRQTA